MSTIAISSLPVTTVPTALDVFPIVQNNVTSQITNADLFGAVPELEVVGGSTLATLSVTGAATVQNVTVGKGPGTGEYTTALGDGALKLNEAGNRHVAIGHNALQSTIFSSDNVAVGDSAMSSTTTGNNNVAVGTGALFNNLTGIDNTAFGYRSLYKITTSGSTGFGSGALFNSTGSNNVAFGYQSGYLITTGNRNTIVGNYTGFGSPINQINSNHVVLSDGAGNVRAYWDAISNATFSGSLTLSGSITTSEFTSMSGGVNTIASASGITPTKEITYISGTAAIDTISSQPPLTAGNGTIILIPTGAFTWTTAGNIAIAGTAVVGKALHMTYVSGNAKWYPSYV